MSEMKKKLSKEEVISYIRFYGMEGEFRLRIGTELGYQKFIVEWRKVTELYSLWVNWNIRMFQMEIPYFIKQI